jgi:branched-chain amino acid transport system substrate-binding protein
VVIGFTVSQTGSSAWNRCGRPTDFNLWVEEINARGGMELEDGSIAKIAAKVYDDESSKDRVRELYTKLVTQDGAELLISPYSSNLTDAAAEIAQQHGKIMITAGAASDSTHTRGYSLIYQSYTPASRYLTGALQLLGKVDPQARQAALICEQDEFAAEACAQPQAPRRPDWVSQSSCTKNMRP